MQASQVHDRCKEAKAAVEDMNLGAGGYAQRPTLKRYNTVSNHWRRNAHFMLEVEIKRYMHPLLLYF